MKKLIIAIFITTAFSLAYGMEKAPKNDDQKATKLNHLNIQNLINGLKGFIGLACAGFCIYLANFSKGQNIILPLIRIDEGNALTNPKEIALVLPNPFSTFLPLVASGFLMCYSLEKFKLIGAQSINKEDIN